MEEIYTMVREMDEPQLRELMIKILVLTECDFSKTDSKLVQKVVREVSNGNA